MIKDYEYYPLTLKIITNKATSIQLQNGSWVIDPVFDLNTNQARTIFEVFAQVHNHLKNTISLYVPRFNTGGFEPALADVKDHIAVFDKLYRCALFAYINEFKPGVSSNSIVQNYGDWSGATQEQMRDIEGINRTTLTAVLGSEISATIQPPEGNSDSNLLGYYDFSQNNDFSVLTIKFAGVEYRIIRHYKADKHFMPVYLNLAVTRADGVKEYWDIEQQCWVSVLQPTSGFCAYVQNNQQQKVNELSVRDLISLVKNYVVSKDYLPKTVPVNGTTTIVTGNPSQLIRFNRLDSGLLELPVRVGTSFSLGVVSDWEDFEWDSVILSWHVHTADDKPYDATFDTRRARVTML